MKGLFGGVIFFSAVLQWFVSSAHLPSYITPCSLSDPAFSECAIKEANRAVQHLAKGDKRYKIQKLDPIILPVVKIETGPNSRLWLKNVTTYDLKRSLITSFNINTQQNTLKASGAIDRLELNAQYDVKGTLLSVPISGTGRGNVTIVNGKYTFLANYTLKTIDNEEYLNFEDTNLVFDAERAYFYLHNIFGENQQLSDELNKNINENWEFIAKDIYPFFGNVMKSVTESVYNGIFQNVPFKEVFLP